MGLVQEREPWWCRKGWGQLPGNIPERVLGSGARLSILGDRREGGGQGVCEWLQM